MSDASRTTRVRIDVENADFRFRPDMYVNVELHIDMGEGLAVPVSAVLPTGQRNIAFVDKGGGKVEPRFIELGRKYGDRLRNPVWLDQRRARRHQRQLPH